MPKVYSSLRTQANRNVDTEVTDCTKREASEQYKTRKNVTTGGKHSTLLWKGAWKKRALGRVESIGCFYANTHPR